MKKLITKLLQFIFPICILISTTSCEPVVNPEGGINEFITGYVTCEGIPIQGIKVSSNYGYTITDENGYFEILSYYLVDSSNSSIPSAPQKTHELIFTDIDGDSNYNLKEKIIKQNAGISEPIIVMMEKNL